MTLPDNDRDTDKTVDRPKLLVVARDQYPPYRIDVVQLYSLWVLPSVQITWVMKRRAAGPSKKTCNSGGERFHISRRLNGRHFARLVTELLWFALLLRTLISILRGRYDIVQVRDLPVIAAPFLIAAHFARKPFVYWMTFPMVEEAVDRIRQSYMWGSRTLASWGYNLFGKSIFYNFVVPRSDRLLVQSEQMGLELLERGVTQDKITAVPMGISPEFVMPNVPPIVDKRVEGREVLCYLGSIESIRKIEKMVEVLAGVVDEGLDATLVIVGGSSEADRERLRSAAESLAVRDRLIFTGHVPHTEMLAWLARADVCLSPIALHPRFSACSPTKLVEYMAMGRPVVASDHQSQIGVMAESGAGLCVPLDVDSFRIAVVSLLRNRNLAQAMGKKGPHWVLSNRAYDRIAERIVAVYHDLSDQRSAS